MVLALSAFPRKGDDGVVRLRKTNYVYMISTDSEEKIEFQCDGYYQLDPIPQFICSYIGRQITDVVVLATPETSVEAEEKYKKYKVHPLPDGEDGTWEGGVADYFKQRLCHFLSPNPMPVYHEIAVDPMKPADALMKVMDKIRELYEQTDNPSENWRLWIDTHGGFRDVSVVLTSAARFFAVDTRQEPLRTDGIFSVLHSQGSAEDVIVDQTAFYFAESADAMRKFLSYGQYLTKEYKPYDGGKAFAFVSYSHAPEYLTHVRNIFDKLEDHAIPFWFDDGIRYREDWRSSLEEKNDASALFIGLLSPQYFASVECWKELMRAMHHRHDAHFFLLEERMDIKALVEKALRDQEIAEMTSSASEEEILRYLGADKQCIQWYRYMGENQGVNERKLAEDEYLTGALESISESLKNKKQTPETLSGNFVNFSNHPSEKWSKEQMDAALQLGKEIADIPFPAVSPEASEEEIMELAKQLADKILKQYPTAVMCMGEFNLSYQVIKILKEHGIRVVAACTERNMREENGERIYRFCFVKFREYV